MSEKTGEWMTTGEMGKSLGGKKSKEVLEDLLYERRSRREILDLVMEATGCNEYSADDFLREIVKPQ